MYTILLLSLTCALAVLLLIRGANIAQKFNTTLARAAARRCRREAI